MKARRFLALVDLVTWNVCLERDVRWFFIGAKPRIVTSRWEEIPYLERDVQWFVIRVEPRIATSRWEEIPDQS